MSDKRLKDNPLKPMFLTIDQRLVSVRRRVLAKFKLQKESETSVPNGSNSAPLKASRRSTDTKQKFQLTMAKLARRTLIGLFMAIFISVVQLYTIVTLPIYYLIQKPWIRTELTKKRRVMEWEKTGPEGSSTKVTPELEEEEKQMSPVYVRAQKPSKSHPLLECTSMMEALGLLTKLYDPNTECLGYRKVLSEEDSLDEHGRVKRLDGRQLKRYRLSDYQWYNYGQVESITKSIAQGLTVKGVSSKDKVLLLSETRVEWMLAAQGIMRTGATVVTLFSNLGIDGIAHGIEETEVETVITSFDGIPLLKQVLSSKPNSVKRIIFIDGFNDPDLDGFNSELDILPLSELQQIGKQVIADDKSVEFAIPGPDHVLIIMYTSGTTGTPKAAIMTQKQFIGAFNAIFVLVEPVLETAPYHRYIAYLPMAHVLELTVEFFLFLGGVRVGYASPFTLTDSAPGLAKKEKSDIKLLKPTIITAVPLVLDRILKEVHEKLRARTPVSESVFKFLMNYKSRWTRRGYQCDIVRKLLCSKVREQLGGHLQYMIVGGAPLDARTQSTIKSALDVTLVQGYGATETTGAALCMSLDDLDYGNVGAPLGQVLLRLKDWPEGGYSKQDKPNPRGEILVGGDVIVAGYFKLPKQSEEAFFTDRQGVRWFRTGDIGEMCPNGSVKIIDRRKDLIKLQNGEYISLGKVEAALKASRYVDNVCVYGGTFSSDVVALVSPNKKSLTELAAKLGKQNFSDPELCADEEIEEEIYTDIVLTSRSAKLGKKEIPLRIRLVADEWSPDNGILTAALKLKRRVIESKYKKELFELYNEKKIHVITSSPKSYDQNNNLNNNNGIGIGGDSPVNGSPVTSNGST